MALRAKLSGCDMKPCFAWLKGHCTSQQCNYLHPNLASAGLGGSTPTAPASSSAIACRFFAQGICRKGTSCPFSHTAPATGGAGVGVGGPASLDRPLEDLIPSSATFPTRRASFSGAVAAASAPMMTGSPMVRPAPCPAPTAPWHMPAQATVASPAAVRSPYAQSAYGHLSGSVALPPMLPPAAAPAAVASPEAVFHGSAAAEHRIPIRIGRAAQPAAPQPQTLRPQIIIRKRSLSGGDGSADPAIEGSGRRQPASTKKDEAASGARKRVRAAAAATATTATATPTKTTVPTKAKQPAVVVADAAHAGGIGVRGRIVPTFVFTAVNGNVAQAAPAVAPAPHAGQPPAPAPAVPGGQADQSAKKKKKKTKKTKPFQESATPPVAPAIERTAADVAFDQAIAQRKAAREARFKQQAAATEAAGKATVVTGKVVLTSKAKKVAADKAAADKAAADKAAADKAAADKAAADKAAADKAAADKAARVAAAKACVGGSIANDEAQRARLKAARLARFSSKPAVAPPARLSTPAVTAVSAAAKPAKVPPKKNLRQQQSSPLSSTLPPRPQLAAVQRQASVGQRRRLVRPPASGAPASATTPAAVTPTVREASTVAAAATAAAAAPAPPSRARSTTTRPPQVPAAAPAPVPAPAPALSPAPAPAPSSAPAQRAVALAVHYVPASAPAAAPVSAQAVPPVDDGVVSPFTDDDDDDDFAGLDDELAQAEAQLQSELPVAVAAAQAPAAAADDEDLGIGDMFTSAPIEGGGKLVYSHEDSELPDFDAELRKLTGAT